MVFRWELDFSHNSLTCHDTAKAHGKCAPMNAAIITVPPHAHSHVPQFYSYSCSVEAHMLLKKSSSLLRTFGIRNKVLCCSASGDLGKVVQRSSAVFSLPLPIERVTSHC